MQGYQIDLYETLVPRPGFLLSFFQCLVSRYASKITSSGYHMSLFFNKVSPHHIISLQTTSFARLIRIPFYRIIENGILPGVPFLLYFKKSIPTGSYTLN